MEEHLPSLETVDAALAANRKCSHALQELLKQIEEEQVEAKDIVTWLKVRARINVVSFSKRTSCAQWARKDYFLRLINHRYRWFLHRGC